MGRVVAGEPGVLRATKFGRLKHSISVTPPMGCGQWTGHPTCKFCFWPVCLVKAFLFGYDRRGVINELVLSRFADRSRMSGAFNPCARRRV
jgi:hypothetical protein